jgi:hypothetical protein
MKNLEHTEIKEPVALCDAKGNFNPSAAGWSRFPLQLSNLKGHALRKKKWNYWCITSDKYLFSITISDADYTGLVFVYYMNFETGEYGEDTLIIPFGAGITMGEQIHDKATYYSPSADVVFSYSGNTITLSTNWKKFGKHKLESEINITIPEKHETLNVVVPWSATRFQYTSKQHCLPADGFFKIGEKEYRFSPDTSFACQDFGRGVWPYSIAWNWGAFSTRVSGHTVGFNSGDKWTDGTGITENAVCIDGKLYKITDSLKWVYNDGNFMAPWTIKSNGSNDVNLTFTPFFDRTGNTNLLLLKTQVHQCFGRYNGHINAGGVTLDINNAIGWAEEHKARW